MIYEEERIAIFIDGANAYASTRSLEWAIDWGKVLKHFQSKAYVNRAFYYTGLPVDTEKLTNLRTLTDWLDYNGFTVRTKQDREYRNGNGDRVIRADLAVELTVDAMRLKDKIDHMILFSGDGDYAPLLEEMQRNGIRVTVFGSEGMTADILRRIADRFENLADFEKLFKREGRG